jgi:hypothetical protein
MQNLENHLRAYYSWQRNQGAWAVRLQRKKFANFADLFMGTRPSYFFNGTV